MLGTKSYCRGRLPGLVAVYERPVLVIRKTQQFSRVRIRNRDVQRLPFDHHSLALHTVNPATFPLNFIAKVVPQRRSVRMLSLWTHHGRYLSAISTVQKPLHRKNRESTDFAGVNPVRNPGTPLSSKGLRFRTPMHCPRAWDS